MGKHPSSSDPTGDAWDRAFEDKRVLVEWGREGDAFDVKTHVVTRTVGLNVVDTVKGTPVKGWDPVEERVRCRIFTHQEVALIGDVAGFDVVETFGDMKGEHGLEDEDAHNMVIVLKKR